MTPRTVKGAPSTSFAQQLAEHNASEQPRKRFKSSAAPRGVKLGGGYSDRALQRTLDEGVGDDRARRITALEEQMKLGQIERSTFEKIRDQITAGDVGATHLVKGLDRKLLARIKRGEDVMAAKEAPAIEMEWRAGQEEPETEVPTNPEDELEKLEQADVVPVHREEAVKMGEMRPPPSSHPGKKRSRADILAELKSSRQAADGGKTASQSGSRFRKFGTGLPEPRIEKDENGREILITVDENGRVKRKVRKMATEHDRARVLPMPNTASTPLGMIVPEAPRPVEDEEGDIFEGVGYDYDPLGPGPDDESDSSSSDLETADDGDDKGVLTEEAAAARTESRDAPSGPSVSNRNYFNEKDPTPESETHEKGLNDPAILDSLKRAAAIPPEQTQSEHPFEQSKELSSAAQRLFQRDRDLDDMDMGFGDSRFGDQEDEEGGTLKLSDWKGMDAEDDDDAEDKVRGGQGHRKRGKKKKKGDKNSAADVLGVLEQRK